MPIYEYSCQKCGAHLEVMQKISDEPLARHEKCGGKLQKEWSRTGFQFKGSGWYVTDYAGKKAESSDGKADAKADSTESKPAAEAKETKESKPVKESKKSKGPKASAAAAGD